MIKNHPDLSFQKLELPCKKFEALAIKLSVKKQSFALAVCYKPSITDVHLLPELDNMLLFLESLTIPYVVLGDFNLPNIDWSIPSSPKVYQQNLFLDCFLKFGLYQKVTEPTRQQHMLDLVFANDPNLIDCTIVKAPVGSCDHNTVWFDLNVPLVAHEFREKYIWNKMDQTAVTICLEMTNWSDVFSNVTTANDMWVRFVEYCDEIFKKFVPKSIPRKAKRNFLPKPLRNLLAKKCSVHRSLRANFSVCLRQKYREISKKCDKELFLHQFKKESEVLDHPNTKKFYSYIKNNLNSISRIPTLIDDQVEYVTDFEKASVLNKQFAKAFVDELQHV